MITHLANPPGDVFCNTKNAYNAQNTAIYAHSYAADDGPPYRRFCERCLELYPLMLLAETDLGGGAPGVLCVWCCQRPGTHYASYDDRWTCETCIY